jgi:aryl carrier-like protein
MGRAGAVRKGRETGRCTHRQRELEWRRTHLDVLRRLAGQWVVLEGEELIAHGRDAVRVVARARRKGVAVPFVFFVEPPDPTPTAQIGL